MKIDNDFEVRFYDTESFRSTVRRSAVGDDDEKHPLERRNVKRMKFKMNITPNTARLHQPSTALFVAGRKKRNLFERQSHFSLEIKFQRVPAIVFVYDCRSTDISQSVSQPVGAQSGKSSISCQSIALSPISPFDAT